MPSRDALMLPDVLTEGDNLEMPPLPDASFLFAQMDDDTSHLGRKRRAGSRDINLQDDFSSSQFLQSSIENRNVLEEEELALEPMDDIDLGLDFGLDIDDNVSKVDRSIEIGRKGPAARAVEDDLFSELDMRAQGKDNLDVSALPEPSFNLGFDEDEIRMGDNEGDIDMINIGAGPDISALPIAPARERISESPLSDIDETAMQELAAQNRRHMDSTLYEPDEETELSIHQKAPQRVRKQKILEPDADTVISNNKIREQQQNRDRILQPQSFLPRDPEILALMEMQKNGGFVSSVMGGGRGMTWAPELRGMLSIDAVRQANDLKRKRDSGIADMDSDQEQGANKSPRLDLGEAEEIAAAADGGFGLGDTTIGADGTILEMPGDDGFVPNIEDEYGTSHVAAFDETTAPLVHPQDSGPVSVGTTHAVHLLRDRFGADAANSPEKRKKTSVLFQDLLPEATTTRADATKMFFEVLVLATKDAIKVEQQEDILGGPIRVRGKRGLWGAWAEREAGGEIAEEEEAPAAPAPVASTVIAATA